MYGFEGSPLIYWFRGFIPSMIIIPGPSSLELGKRVASELGVEPQTIDHRIFPDGESYVRLTSTVKGETAAIIQTTSPNPDSRLMQLLLTARTAYDYGASKVIAVVPYLAYSRQDKRFLDMEALSLDVIFYLLESVKISDLIVIDAHNAASLSEIEKKHNVKVHNLSAIPLLAERLKAESFDGAYCLSPDKGAIHLAEKASRVIGGGHDFFEKIRDRRTGEIEMQVKNLDIEGKRAIVFDDIISSGGTMARAIEVLKSQGAERLAAACSHPLFMGGAEDKIRRAGADTILASDTVETPFSKVSVSGIVARCLKEIE